MREFEATIQGKRIFLTGDSGFTGTWLAQWLHALDCDVFGFSLEPETNPNLASILGASAFKTQTVGDVANADAVRAAMEAASPHLVFHLAAQPLVRRSYRDPIETFSSNVMGTASVMEAARNVPSVEAVVCITTDKVYRNHEWPHPYRENDVLGGKDPYSASKACAELVVDAYRQTMMALGNGAKVATARGGNIIGGGDWAEDRIVPDFYRAAYQQQPLVIRNPGAVRPWQHVLSACHGYLAIAHELLTNGDAEASAHWNIGPADDVVVSVGDLVELLADHSRAPEIKFEGSRLHEAQMLRLDISKASQRLRFRSPWSTRETVKRTAEWYAAYYDDSASGAAALRDQLSDYRAALGAESVNKEGEAAR